MAEQLALQQALRQCATINANEALVLTGRQLMDSFSYDFLAGTAFPLDKSVFGNSFINNETFQQYACHGYLNHGLRHIKASLVIPHKTPPANQPAECPFNYPTLRHWLKACLPWCAFHDFHNKSKIGGLVHQ